RNRPHARPPRPRRFARNVSLGVDATGPGGFLERRGSRASTVGFCDMLPMPIWPPRLASRSSGVPASGIRTSSLLASSLLASAILAGCATTPPPPPPPPPPSMTVPPAPDAPVGAVLDDWRGVITASDRDRYQRRAAAWTLALEQASR